MGAFASAELEMFFTMMWLNGTEDESNSATAILAG